MHASDFFESQQSAPVVTRTTMDKTVRMRHVDSSPRRLIRIYIAALGRSEGPQYRKLIVISKRSGSKLVLIIANKAASPRHRRGGPFDPAVPWGREGGPGSRCGPFVIPYMASNYRSYRQPAHNETDEAAMCGQFTSTLHTIIPDRKG